MCKYTLWNHTGKWIFHVLPCWALTGVPKTPFVTYSEICKPSWSESPTWIILVIPAIISFNRKSCIVEQSVWQRCAVEIDLSWSIWHDTPIAIIRWLHFTKRPIFQRCHSLRARIHINAWNIIACARGWSGQNYSWSIIITQSRTSTWSK